ncbi:hypothetical protein COX24_00640 [bacterium (Candidatus Gribaldobacteria) CG23_combo_of_CG06-09_8_20_14_all_37_87_8]|uniref:Ribosomal RNA methyltransferase FtsJ domain-containing protein n=1 Tax=bacterium (Candidatus Gribaldobacteria) CG23_combo_of_CG06-09_8_20_14_all_37_87_8 TaxID=2014278 RepID=A0A2G9ZHC2_9BACT|nr:MAG: hypothetical protein COX24_00640 [bacterium (Candidatus Gribaldobacteria) CG23_combo_of_CG06-09_8_20_14_all_37_87_8]
MGCTPGSWLLYLSNEVGEHGKVVGVDLNEIKNKNSGQLYF